MRIFLSSSTGVKKYSHEVSDDTQISTVISLAKGDAGLPESAVVQIVHNGKAVINQNATLGEVGVSDGDLVEFRSTPGIDFGAIKIPAPCTSTIAIGSSAAVDPLEYLRNTPQFNALRQAVQANPEMLPTLILQMAQSNPLLFQFIPANQQRFVDMLNDPVGQPGDVPVAGGGQGAGGVPLGAGGVTQIQVTPQEKESIERLKQLGFPEALVIQAYFACDKNEQLAANFLLQDQHD